MCWEAKKRGKRKKDGQERKKGRRRDKLALWLWGEEKGEKKGGCLPPGRLAEKKGEKQNERREKKSRAAAGPSARKRENRA